MTPSHSTLIRTAPLRLVIFDCDGVLIDSEGVANRVIAEQVSALGWEITTEESEALFLGWSLADMRPVIEQRTGQALTEAWIDTLARTLVQRLSTDVRPIPGVPDVLHATTALGLPWRIASNSSHAEMAAKFACTGLTDLTAGRIHSAEDVARGKPAPDLFLAVAESAGMHPSECLVIEDSVPGTLGAIAAGMPVLGFAAHTGVERLRQAGAVPFLDMAHLPDLLRRWIHRPVEEAAQ